MRTSRWAVEKQFDSRIEKDRVARENKVLQEAINDLAEQFAFELIDDGCVNEFDSIEYPGL